MCNNPFWLKYPVENFTGRYSNKRYFKKQLDTVIFDGKRHYVINIPCPCGKCSECIKADQKAWSFRLQVEYDAVKKLGLSSYFITLTYDNNSLPVIYQMTSFDTGELLVDEKMRLPDVGIIIPSEQYYTHISQVLHKKDVQDFLKRLRRYINYFTGVNYPIKYFCVGEYGGKYNRPHYHLLLLGLPKMPFVQLCTMLRERWNNGIVRVQSVTSGRIKYITKYMNKVDERKHDVKYFRCVSKGMGLSYLTQDNINYHRNLKTKYVHLHGKKYRLPNYLLNKIFDEDERKEFLQEEFDEVAKDFYVFNCKDAYKKAKSRKLRKDDDARVKHLMFRHFVNSDVH